MIPIIVKITVFTTYIAFIWRRYGVLPSISDSWYSLEKKGKLFTFFLWILGVSFAVMGGMEANMWYFLSGALLCFTGAAAHFKQDVTKEVHNIGAVGGIALALYGLLTQGIFFPLILTTVASLTIHYSNLSNKTWWIEIAAFIFIEIGLISNL